mgnify:FL=1
MLAPTLKLSSGVASLLVLAGCATYPPPSQSYAYFAVPCSTPGAFRADPVNIVPQAGQPQAPPPAAATQPNAEPASAVSAPTCLIAAPMPRANYARNYYGRGNYYDPYYYRYGGYSRPFFGSIGIGLHGGGYGGHGRVSHGGGGHVGGGHGSGGHGGGHGRGH